MAEFVDPLPVERLRRRCRLAPDALSAASDETVAPLDADLAFGQGRAIEAIGLAEAMRRPGFNLFVMGAHAALAKRLVKQRFEAAAQDAPPPSDWVYVNNFDDADRPIAIELPAGRALAFRRDMERLIEELRTALPAVFDSDDYRNRREAIDDEFQSRQEGAFSTLAEEARGRGAAIVRTPVGFAVAPTKGDAVLPPEEFRALDEEERKRIEAVVEDLQGKLQELLRTAPRWEKERREAVRELDQQTAKVAVEHSIQELRDRYCEIEAVCRYLDAARATLVEHAPMFLAAAQEPQPPTGTPSRPDGRFGMFSVNVIVGREPETRGAPVAEEDRPNFQNLIGRVEHIAHQGALLTNFTLIKPGALHRANGGVLLLDSRQLLSDPLAWAALKRALKARSIRIVSPADYLSVGATISLEPDPIPLDAKIVIIGERLHYYLLLAYDPELRELFKLVADFEDDAEWEDQRAADLARLLARLARQDGLRPLEIGAAEALIEHAARLAGDATRLSLDLDDLLDRLREADHYAEIAGRAKIAREDVSQAIRARIERIDRVRDLSHRSILREIALVDTEGSAVGQINGLTVSQVGDLSFGRPARITAQARLGPGKVMDIEREVELGGPLHTKGVLILQGFLAGRYARDLPVSLSATLVFEQSYGGVDGDSASSAELYALLSALADLPLRQDLAVTGSVNQHGQVQAIGGVNEKIEGFFDICAARGLTGRQGVLIPSANVQHLMLREDVVEACRDGRFAVYPIEHVDQGVALLSGVDAGRRGADGAFPEESVNGRVEAALRRFAEMRRRFGAVDGASGAARDDPNGAGGSA